jgi:hypothetical protein
MLSRSFVLSSSPLKPVPDVKEGTCIITHKLSLQVR